MKRKLVLAVCLSLFIIQLGLADCVTICGTVAFKEFEQLDYATRMMQQGKYLDGKAYALDCLRNGTLIILEKGTRIKMVNRPIPGVAEIDYRNERWFAASVHLKCE